MSNQQEDIKTVTTHDNQSLIKFTEKLSIDFHNFL